MNRITSWQRGLELIGTLLGAVTATIGVLFALAPYQPFATKSYVESTISSRLSPLQKIQDTATKNYSTLSSKVDELTDATLTYQIIQMQTQLTELDMEIAAGRATESDRTLAEQLRNEIRRSTILRGQP